MGIGGGGADFADEGPDLGAEGARFGVVAAVLAGVAVAGRSPGAPGFPGFLRGFGKIIVFKIFAGVSPCRALPRPAARGARLRRREDGGERRGTGRFAGHGGDMGCNFGL